MGSSVWACVGSSVHNKDREWEQIWQPWFLSLRQVLSQRLIGFSSCTCRGAWCLLRWASADGCTAWPLQVLRYGPTNKYGAHIDGLERVLTVLMYLVRE